VTLGGAGARAPYEQAAQGHADQARQRVGAKEAEQRRDQPLVRRRHGRLEVVVGGAGEIGVAFAQEQGQAPERAGLDEALALAFEPLEALDVGAHGLALETGQPVRILPQLGESRVTVLPGRAGVLVETRDHAAQLVDRAAEALTILLREFRPLGGDNAPEKPECDSQTARNARQREPPLASLTKPSAAGVRCSESTCLEASALKPLPRLRPWLRLRRKIPRVNRGAWVGVE